MGKKKSKSSQQLNVSTDNKTNDIKSSNIVESKPAAVTAGKNISKKADSNLVKHKTVAATPKSKKADVPLFDLKEIKTFKTLPVLIASPSVVKKSNEAGQVLKQVLHYLYFKLHQPRENTSFDSKITYEADDSQLLPPGRTLFITNLPVDCSDRDLIELFNNHKLAGPGQVVKVLIRTPNSLSIDLKLNSSGKNQDIFVKKSTTLAKDFSELFPSLNTTGKGSIQTLLTYPNYAYIVFKKTESLEKVFYYKLQFPSNNTEEKPDLEKILINSPICFLSLKSSMTASAESGMERWLHRYDVQRPDPKKFQSYLDEYMGEYNHHTELVKYRETLTMDMPDEDGFVKVVRGRTRNATADGATVRAILKADAKALSLKIAADKRRQEQMEVDGTALNFYRIQARDSKKQRLAQLRTQFEEDKKRIAEMKQRNQFRLS